MPLGETLEAIEQADLITIGPGSLFTSIVPNVLVEGIPEALARSRAIKACFVNMMWQPGETIDFSASDHIAAITEHAGGNFIDIAVLNTGEVSEALRLKYEEQRSRPVANDKERLEQMGIEVIGANLLGEGEKIRHNPEAAAEIAMALACRGRQRRTKQ